MRRLKLTIEYKGTNYAGWQVQKNALSVQQVMQEAFKTLLNEDVELVSSSRTDAGVHAMGQTAHFDTESRIPADRIPFAINNLLPDDISVTASEEVTADFHARYSVKSKTYCYRMYYSPQRSPLRDEQYYRINKRPDIALMRLAAQLFLGEHDFKFFEASGSTAKNTVRTINSIKIDEIGNEIILTVSGNGFLYNMVRILAGTLLYVGNGKLTMSNIYDIMSTKDRKKAGKTLPACGLCLLKVEY